MSFLKMTGFTLIVVYHVLFFEPQKVSLRLLNVTEAPVLPKNLTVNQFGRFLLINLTTSSLLKPPSLIQNETKKLENTTLQVVSRQSNSGIVNYENVTNVDNGTMVLVVDDANLTSVKAGINQLYNSNQNTGLVPDLPVESGMTHVFRYLKNAYFYLESDSDVYLESQMNALLGLGEIQWELIYKTGQKSLFKTHRIPLMEYVGVQMFVRFHDEKVKKTFILSSMDLVPTRVGLIRFINKTKPCAQYNQITNTMNQSKSIDFEIFESGDIGETYQFECEIYYLESPSCALETINPKQFYVDENFTLHFNISISYSILVHQYVPSSDGFQLCKNNITVKDPVNSKAQSLRCFMSTPSIICFFIILCFIVLQ